MDTSQRRVVIAGASGLIGSALIRSFVDDGVAVTALVRRAPREQSGSSPGDVTEVQWLGNGAPLDPQVIAGAEAVICLNGASVGHLPWTKKYRSQLYTSRLVPTATIADAVRQLGPEAPLFVSASAVGYYGSAPGKTLAEDAPAGKTFLARLCVEWEAAAASAGGGARVAFLRTAPVLHPSGMLKPMILLTKFGLGGPLGRGSQVWPWISLDDEVRAIRYVVDHQITGPVNLSGPSIATARDIGAELARQMHRPFWFPAPAFLLRAVLGGDAAESLLTADAAAVPRVLTTAGFAFRHRTVAEAVRAGLTSSGPEK